MPDLSSLTNEQLLALSKQQQQPATSDLGSLSDEQLLSLAGEKPVEGSQPMEPTEVYQKPIIPDYEARTFTEELLDPSNIKAGLKQGLRTGAKVITSGLTLGIGDSFVDNLEAKVRSKLGENKSEDQILSEIKQEYQDAGTPARTVDQVLRFGASMLGGGAVAKIGAKALPKAATKYLAGRAGSAAAGGTSAYGESEGDLIATGVGTGLGLISPEIGKAAGKSVGKISSVLGKVAPQEIKNIASEKITNVLNKITTSKPVQSFTEIMGNPKLAGKIKSGVTASKDVASQVNDVAEKALRDTHERVNQAVLQDFGVKSPQELMEQGQKEFSEFSNKYQGKSIPPTKAQNLYESRLIRNEAEAMRANNPAKWKNVPENDIVFLQEVKSKIAAKSRGAGERVDDYRDAKNHITDFLNDNVPGFKEMNQRYAQSKAKEKIADSMMKGGARVGSNIAAMLDKPNIYKEVSDEFGEDVAKKLEKTLIKEKSINKNIQDVLKASNKKLEYKSLSDQAREALNVKNILLGGAGIGAAPVTGGLTLLAPFAGYGAGKGLDYLAAKSARDILGGKGTRELTPQIQAILASSIGKKVGD